MVEVSAPSDSAPSDTVSQSPATEVVKPSWIKIVGASIVGVVGFEVFSFILMSLAVVIFCHDSCGGEALNIIFIGGLLGRFYYLLTYTTVARRFLKNRRSVLISMGIGVSFYAILLIGSRINYEYKSRSQLNDFTSVYDPVQEKSQQTHLRVTSFTEEGVLDPDGLLDSLTINITVISDQDIEINNPFGFIIADQNYPGCRWTTWRMEKGSHNTIQLHRGENRLLHSISKNDLKIYGSSVSYNFEGEVIVDVSFSGHVPASQFRTEERNNSGNGTRIRDVTNETGFPGLMICNLQPSDVAFLTKPYKIRLIFEPYPSPNYSR